MARKPTADVIDVTEANPTEPAAEPEPSTDIEPVQTEPVRRVDHTPEHASAIDAAAAAALAMPGVPGRDEFMSLAMQARMLCMSAGAPEAVQNNPHLAFHLAMVGRDLGISPTAALALIDVIPGRGDKPPQLSLSPQLLNGQIRRLGLGMIVPVERTDTRCVAVAVGPRGIDPRCAVPFPDHADACACDILGTSEFTWDDARLAGLVGTDCEPGAHKQQTRQRRGGGSYQTCGCNQGYITYPKRMLWWRASGFAADDFFPEAGLGLYSPEELGAVVDEDGRPIDPATVELPEGYGPVGERRVEAVPASEEDRARLGDKIGGLSDGGKAALRAAWQQELPNGGYLMALGDLPQHQVKVADALVQSVAVRDARGEFAQDAVTAPDSPQDGPGATAGPEGATVPSGADEGDLPECLHDGCGEPVTVVTDEGEPWCADHAPI